MALALICLCGTLWGQEAAAAREPEATLQDFLQKSEEYQNQLKRYCEVLDGQIARLQKDLEIRQAAFDDGLISKLQVDDVGASLAAAKETRAAQQQALLTVRQTVVEVQAAYRQFETANDFQWARFTGTRTWDLGQIEDLKSFFQRRFGRELPVSAYGQTATHVMLGFNHHGRVDLAVHPESVEGKALMVLLRELGVPFTAFGGPLKGAATGAHIHLGPPSPRLN